MTNILIKCIVEALYFDKEMVQQMEAIHIQQTVQKRGELTIRNLPVEAGQQVEVLLLLTPSEKSQQPGMTARQLLHSGLIGLWKDRQDIPDSANYARQLREEAQRRPTIGDMGEG
ncbi:MAG TPA: hypothetical protein PLD25_20880 [Chloroflexota bacterium]|nr:hypothetical protein [Chloroflexota bacterium]HUM70282.1 hypothetical protein [Chloroflexota bacterium]